MSDYTNECYNSGFLLDKDYLPYETKVNDEVLGLIFRTLFKLPDNATSGTDTSPDFSGYKAKAKAKGLIQDAIVFGGLNLASSFYDGNKNYSKYLGLDLIGVEFAKDPSGYTASRIVNNVKRNNLMSVASTSTKNWLVKNGYKGDIAVGNPICLLYKLGLFNERSTASKGNSQRLAFIVGPKSVTPNVIENNTWNEYNAIIELLKANVFTDLAVESPSIFNTLRVITNARCIVTNSATIYEAAVICGCFPIYLKTSYNDCEYAIRSFCKDLDIPFTYTFFDTLLTDYSRYMISENNGTFQDGEWDHHFDNDSVYDYRVIGNPYPKIIEYNNELLASFPFEWKYLYLNLYQEKTHIKVCNGPNIVFDTYFPAGSILSRNTRKYYDTIDNTEVSLPAQKATDRINLTLGTQINQLFHQEQDVTDKLDIYGTYMYFHLKKSFYENAISYFFKLFLGSIGMLQYGTEEIISILGKDSFKSSLILFSYFLKDPKSYKASRLQQNLSTRDIKSTALKSDKDFLVSKNIIHSDIPIVCPFVWAWLKPSEWVSNIVGLDATSYDRSYLCSNSLYKYYASDTNAVNLSIPQEISDEEKLLLVCNVISRIYNSRIIYTDDLLAYMLCEYANKPCYYINESGKDKKTFNQIFEFAQQVQNPVIALDKDTLPNIEKYSIYNIEEQIKKQFYYHDGKSTKDSNETYKFLKLFKANYYNNNFNLFISKLEQDKYKSNVLINFYIDDAESRARWTSLRDAWVAEYSRDVYKHIKYKEGPFGIMIEDGYEWDPLYYQIVQELKNRQFTPVSKPSSASFKWYVRHSIFEREGNEETNSTLYKRIDPSVSKYNVINQPGVLQYENAKYNGSFGYTSNIEIDDNIVLDVYCKDVRVWTDDQFKYNIVVNNSGVEYE